MTDLHFPENFPPPLVPYATGGGDSYKVTIHDSTIAATTEGGYKITRPRNTRVVHTWTFAWGFLADADYRTLAEFYGKVGRHTPFLYDMDGIGTVTVRFSNEFSAQRLEPVGWQVSLSLEEV